MATLPQSNMRFSKLRWLLTLGGLILYLLDIYMDIKLAVTYFQETNYIWCGLTVWFILNGLVVTQIFSYALYIDDMDGHQTTAGMSKGKLAALHVLGLGNIMRYYHLLKQMKTNPATTEQMKEKHCEMFCMATDLCMLKLFEAFVESAPQLLLQLYILFNYNKWSVFRYITLGFSFFNVAWALVDYRRCLRRSISAYRRMPSGLTTTVYFLYKLCTITSHILSYSLFLILSIYTTVGLSFLWLLGFIWATWLQTSFCSSRVLEYFYRGLIGVILLFTFFNVKGQDTKVDMIVYYVCYSVINVTAPILLFFLRPELQMSALLFIIGGFIFGASVLGLVCLVVYYCKLHPRGGLQDEVDGMNNEAETTTKKGKKIEKVRSWLQP